MAATVSMDVPLAHRAMRHGHASLVPTTMASKDSTQSTRLNSAALLSLDVSQELSAEDVEINACGVPLDALLEERKLHQQREEEEAKAQPAVPASKPLDKDRFAALNQLLYQSEMYSSIMYKEMQNVQDELVEEARIAARTHLLAGSHAAAAAAAATARAARTAAAGASKARKGAKAAAAATASQPEGAALSGRRGRSSVGQEQAAAPAAAGKRTRAELAGGGGGRGAKRGAAKKDSTLEEQEHNEPGEDVSAEPGAGGATETSAAPEMEGVPKVKLTPTQELLPLMNVELHGYQLIGVKWLISLYQNGLNGILADQMGLGKTVQTIGFLSHLRMKGIKGPFLIVAPLSTLYNWTSEFKRFLPCVTPLLYHGTKQERADMRVPVLAAAGRSPLPDNFPVIITSFEIIIADIAFFTKIKWQYIAVDEGHRLKNCDCKLIRELRTIPAENRLLLSGTPLQNNLSELWSLLNFLMPELFKVKLDFEAWFDFSNVGQDGASEEIMAAEQRTNVVSKLHAILKPFMLRRLKTDVDLPIPLKKEMVLWCPMSATQKLLQAQLSAGTLKEAMAAMAEEEGGNGKLNIQNVLMQLRKICNHPDLVTSPFTMDYNYPSPEVLVGQCGKMGLMERLLNKLLPRGHKVLIFSQMTKVLDIIESYATQKGITVSRLDGTCSQQNRQANIQAFNTDAETKLFLLSTRAGGLGINLTAADTVIIYDSDWNPHQDLQAMDRCHRIGQTKPVLVFRLATSHSVEGKMLKRAADKMALERLVIKKGAFHGKQVEEGKDSDKGSMLSAAELVDMLKVNYRMDGVPQSGIVTDEVMDQLLDRRYLVDPEQAMPYALADVGYELVESVSSSGLLIAATA